MNRYTMFLNQFIEYSEIYPNTLNWEALLKELFNDMDDITSDMLNNRDIDYSLDIIKIVGVKIIRELKKSKTDDNIDSAFDMMLRFSFIFGNKMEFDDNRKEK